MRKLSVNVDHVATLRQARMAKEPEPIAVALMAEMAGANGITVHLREDRRHIQDRDVRLLKELIKIPLNLEMAATDEMVGIALSISPSMVTLVPEKRQELTTEGGLDLITYHDRFENIVKTFRENGIEVSFFIEPDIKMVKAASKLNAHKIELHTGHYANADTEAKKIAELQKLEEAAKLGIKYGLIVNAGHGLTYENVSRVAQIREISEFSIGHSIISRSLLTGIQKAVADMLILIQ